MIESFVVTAQRPELPEPHVDQRYQAGCKSCGWAGVWRFFRERAEMDGRSHVCGEVLRG